MAKKDHPIMIAAGGTGGHVYPGLAVARALIEQGIPVVWMGTRKGLESRIIPEADIPMTYLSVTGLRGKGMGTLLLAPFKLAKALIQSISIMMEYKPAAVLGMGGFVAGPGGLVAALMGKPLVIHEQNAVSGMTNKLLSKVAKEVLEGFPGTFPKSEKNTAVGNPVRMDIAAIPAPEIRLQDRDGAFRLLVVGGSLGAMALNEIVPKALALLPSGVSVEVVHQAGKKTLDVAEHVYEKNGVQAHIVPFIEDMAGAYEWADLIICRAGALTIAEVSAAGLASVLVPYPYAVDDHQTENARYLAEQGAAILTQQSELDAQSLADVITVLDDNRERLMVMSQKARELARIKATSEVAAICAEYAGYDFDKEFGNKMDISAENNNEKGEAIA
jgi:UDP-N-acetylglucosamine--N-acetylmuramyl-(pentapeptide) pyrophosphoryl-undecaprenol N-acetylglucosamine transferase